MHTTTQRVGDEVFFEILSLLDAGSFDLKMVRLGPDIVGFVWQKSIPLTEEPDDTLALATLEREWNKIYRWRMKNHAAPRFRVSLVVRFDALAEEADKESSIVVRAHSILLQ